MCSKEPHFSASLCRSSVVTRRPPNAVSQHTSSQESTLLGHSSSSLGAKHNSDTTTMATSPLVIKQEPKDEESPQENSSLRVGLDACTENVLSDNHTGTMSFKTEHYQETSRGLSACARSVLPDYQTDGKYIKTEHHQETSVELNTRTVVKQEPDDKLELNRRETSGGFDKDVASDVSNNRKSIKTEHQESPKPTLPVAMIVADDVDEDVKPGTRLAPVALYRNVHSSRTETSNDSESLSPHTDRVSNPAGTGDKPFVCKECGAVFSKSDYLKKHLFTHTGERPFVCDWCNAAFSRHDTLKQHVLTHTGERPYECKHCGADFNRASTLRKHTRTHTGERKYKCDHCEATFYQTSNWKRHMRTHTGEKPYVCDECEKRFADYSSLQRHTLLHAKGRHCVRRQRGKHVVLKNHASHAGHKSYACTLCGEAFNQSSTLNTHMVTHGWCMM